MPVFETFAARKKASEQSGVVDVYIYDSLPTFLRRQLVLLFTSCIGPGHRSDDYYTVENNNRAWDFIAGVMCREVESFSPISGMALSFDQCMTYLQTSTDIDGVLSLVEICCRYMHTVVTTLNRHERENLGITQEARDGLKEISARFRQNAVGYSCDEGRIIRVDSEFVHAEIVKDALALLTNPAFKDANSEFRKAHTFYRAGDFRDCNTATLRSMESLLKVICEARGWQHDPGATVEKLISVARQNGLFPDYLGGSFDQLIGAMKGGLPKVRDKQGGHGAAPKEQPIPDYIAGYALHLTASNIVFLAKAYEAMR